jgi:hypothetical protein
VQVNGCHALGWLFGGESQASKHARLAAEATRTIVAAMAAHASDRDVQHKGCLALTLVAITAWSNGECKAAAAEGIDASVAALRTHAANAEVQAAGCVALRFICNDAPGHQAKAALAGGIEAVVQTLRLHAADVEVQKVGWGALRNMVQNSRGCVQRANAAGALGDAVVAFSAAMGTAAAVADLFDAVCGALLELVPGHEAAAVLAGVLEALEEQKRTTATSEATEAARTDLIRQLQPAAQQHDARPCTHAGCKRCEAARAHGAMCLLAGCTISAREGGKNLKFCTTCRTARYCGEAHQRDDWQRHKPECFALRDRQQAGTSSAAE